MKSVFGGVAYLAWYLVTCILVCSSFKNNWFMVGLRSSTREAAKHEGSVIVARGDHPKGSAPSLFLI